MKNNILQVIIDDKKREVDALLSDITESDLYPSQPDQRIPLDFKRSLVGKPLAIIAEVKKASPSKGLIRQDFDPIAIASAYQTAGADCISVLTEKKHFQGDPKFLVEIKQNVNCPLLRKDFIVDPRQIRESYEMGADAILLIVAVLSVQELSRFYGLAKGFGLTCLVEVHTEEELELALSLPISLIGINNRNLTTFVTDIAVSLALKKRIPESIITVSESGISSAEDCLKLKEVGFNAVLVGETLMRQPDPGSALIKLMSLVR